MKKYCGRFTKNCVTQHHKRKFWGGCKNFHFLSKLLDWSVNFLIWVREIDILLFTLVFLTESNYKLFEGEIIKNIKDQEFKKQTDQNKTQNKTKNHKNQNNTDSVL